ncbi:NAD(P)-binding domain-containing protein [Actinoplanes sp. TBRC 11911]|uniref:flavin-containing monooxygenase n=1 Tax=Actinoplanes sp. TBRC 11911 TaxID=2729386 RepID=UPI00145CED03|nr:NAD(P)/FAD-dependent oxidoreductase [Actinoplanes sp. TBRC 11911]NMO57714.1 NAD(P)-binding domain-containing protein [Actinoplanes sp. TBRC 11911]
MTNGQSEQGDNRTDVVVVGAGPAGLATSWHLSLQGIRHVVLERDVVGATWRFERWDDFALVNPAWSIRLPGLDVSGLEPDSYLSRDAVVGLLDSYARSIKAPVRAGVEVFRLRQDGAGYHLSTSEGDWHARAVVVASGAFRRPWIPDHPVPPGVTALHAIDYRRPDQLADGAVLVVGSGQSGTQIADELRGAGREVYLSTSAVGRMPRRYRGRDFYRWLRDLGDLDQPSEQVPDEIRRAPQAAVSGTHGGRTSALQQLARDGIVLLGRLSGTDGGRFLFADDLAKNMDVADAFAARFRSHVDEYLQNSPDPLLPPDADPAERPLDVPPDAPVEIDAAQAGVSTVVWCTGMRPDTLWLPDDLLEPSGFPQHQHGSTAWPGVHVVGFPWQTHRASGVLYGIPTDAERAADRILLHLAS